MTEYPCDSVVVAIGARSRNLAEISSYCNAKGIPCHVIGDAVRARRALNAVAEANEVARAI
ncbi:hypothetical protein [Paenibacillus sp. YN15]|uniref:hypothetical protein n=1 Tax=Paenibacillus sp. YN15 TaxID=1742774 RepID=UPI000DCBE7EB|nr:hypothetical protein [Paenibacillus sp. YN15]RAV00548.1 hypothetical protein DQG13_13980 [Paenibacillus sp. YN15]